MIEFKKSDTFIELDIIVNDEKIGYAEIEPDKKELSRLEIDRPYRNKGYGTEAVKRIIDEYNVDNLWVRSDNDEAIHIYEKCGFVRDCEAMFKMVRK